MVILLLCALGFGLLAVAEWAAISGLRLPSVMAGLGGYAGVGIALFRHASGEPPEWAVFAQAGQTASPGFWMAIGGIVAALSLVLLIWTVFLEIPRERRRMGIDERGTVRTGSYGSCRHPGWWWLAIHALSWCVIRPGASMPSDALTIIGGNLALVYAQDRWFFPSRFDDYGEYRDLVPFLFPRARRGTGARTGR